MTGHIVGALTPRTMLLAGVLLVPLAAGAQQASTDYPNRAPIEQYLMADQSAEIGLARSAAPTAVSQDATILVLGQRGYETAVEGRSGFTCIVERSWMSPFDSPEFWNPRMRAPICYNAPATRSVLPYTIKTTQWVLAGLSKVQVRARVEQASASKELPAPEPGAMSYMMSKSGYLGDSVGPWHPHLMFHIPKTDGASWGANVAGSPVMLDTQYRDVPEPETIFMVAVDWWSDGTPGPAMSR